ncbi:MAG: BPSS1780 family membrane protein [Lamprobacter sp.]|uniref:BPSS1780 family membrane protein n=1 Tax=Lamprobacter sp. TaxID=3100796 RepID=UPI002B25EF85|nr:BPSS1780 family membrane protein [Lamprobacter sp.]MEA3640182.1 BPSS1780 family membrane protein [Lamprobacter sp.]
MAQVFKVVFTGTLDPAVDPENAVRDFATVFKVSEPQARELIAAGQARALKTDVDADNARRYQEVLAEIGLASRIEPMEADAAVADVGGQVAAAERAAVDAAGDGAAGPSGSPGTHPQGPLSLAKQTRDRVSAAGVAGGDGGQRRFAPVRRPASHGWYWITQAWQQFKVQPRGWLAAVALVYLVTFALSLVPVIGSLATMILGPIFAGGLMLGAQSQERQGRLRLTAGFDGFSPHGGQLALVGLLYLLGLFVAVMVAALISMATGVLTVSSMEALSSSDPAVVAAALGPALGLFLLVVMLTLVPLLMLYWFAPALVALEGMTAIEAMRMSFNGCWKNLIPFVVYGLALVFILVGASLVLGMLGALLAAVSESLMVVLMLLMIPLMLVFAALVVLSIYSAYRDIFHGATPPQGTHVF